jgi:hypothetical protein
VLAAVFARLVIVGADGRRLHEEVMLAARVVPPSGRSRRLELEQPRYARLREAVEGALEPQFCQQAAQPERHLVVTRWPELEPLLAADVRTRAAERITVLERDLARQRDDEIKRTEAVFGQLKLMLKSAVEGPGPIQLTFDDLGAVERQQLDRDRHAWQARLDGLDDEQARELAATGHRYAGIKDLVFPFAVAVCVPDGEADR